MGGVWAAEIVAFAILCDMTWTATLADSDASAICWVFGIGIVVAIVVLAMVSIAQKQKADERMASVRARSDFAGADVFVSPYNGNGIAISPGSTDLLLIRKDEQTVLAASGILAVEILADDTSIVSTNRGSQIAGAAVGGALLGPVGLLLGGLSGSTRSETKIKTLKLRIVTTDFSRPNHDIQFFRDLANNAYKRDSFVLRGPIADAEKWHSRVTALMRAASTAPAFIPQTASASMSDELRKLADLRRDGILTEEEFQEQKRQLLAKGG